MFIIYYPSYHCFNKFILTFLLSFRCKSFTLFNVSNYFYNTFLFFTSCLFLLSSFNSCLIRCFRGCSCSLNRSIKFYLIADKLWIYDLTVDFLTLSNSSLIFLLLEEWRQSRVLFKLFKIYICSLRLSSISLPFIVINNNTAIATKMDD